MPTCEERFLEIFLFARKCAAVIGEDVFDENFHYTFLTWIVLAFAAGYFILTGYTIYVGVYIDGDWTAILKAICMSGSAIQSLVKFLSGTFQNKRFREMFEHIDEIYRVYQEKHIEYQQVLNNSSSLISKALKLSAALWFFGCSTIVALPIFYWIFYGEKIFVMQFLIPGIDPSTHSGHLIHMAAHFCGIFIGAFGNFAGDMYIYIFLLHVPLFKNILKVKFEDLNKVSLESDEDNYEKTMPMLVDILSWHREYTIYTRSLSDLYFGVFLCQISTAAGGIIVTVFITFMGAWPAGYAYLCILFATLYAYCGMGTLTEIANDDVCDQIYNNCLWYRLSIKERKMLIMMLRMSQNPTRLTVGSVMPLSVTTALSVTKTIYSFFMMLINLTEE